jgi:RNA polymerase sigma-70 factor (ECF subfamily)
VNDFGDRQQFADFYNAHRDAVYRAVLLSTRRPDRAEDATADAFARAFERWSELAKHPGPAAWVARTALNAFVSGWRRWRRETNDVPEIIAMPEERASLDPELLRLLWRLPRRQREVVALRVLLDLDTRTTSRALGIAEGTVGVHLQRALRALRLGLSESANHDKEAVR